MYASDLALKTSFYKTWRYKPRFIRLDGKMFSKRVYMWFELFGIFYSKINQSIKYNTIVVGNFYCNSFI